MICSYESIKASILSLSASVSRQARTRRLNLERAGWASAVLRVGEGGAESVGEDWGEESCCLGDKDGNELGGVGSVVLDGRFNSGELGWGE